MELRTGSPVPTQQPALRQPRVGRPDSDWHRHEMMRKHETVLESWLSGTTKPTTPRSRSAGRPSRPGTPNRNETPRFYDSIADYLVHLEVLSKKRKFQAYLQQLRQAREDSSQPLISDKSRVLAERRRMAKCLELFHALDTEKIGKLHLSAVDDTTLSRIDALQDRQFVLGILIDYAKERQRERPEITDVVLSLQTFVERALERLKTQRAPRSILSRSKSPVRTRTELTFRPELSQTSRSIVTSKRSGMNSIDRISQMLEEPKRWQKKAEDLKKRLADEEVAECTFQPHINTQSRQLTPSSNARLFAHKTIRQLDARTSTQKEFDAFCTFSPKISSYAMQTPRKGVFEKAKEMASTPKSARSATATASSAPASTTAALRSNRPPSVLSSDVDSTPEYM